MPRVNPFSLLWPNGEPTTHKRYWNSTVVADLELEHIVTALNYDGKHEREMQAILLTPCDDAETIGYRQAIIEDLLNCPDLLQQFRDLLPLMNDLSYYGRISEMEDLLFQKTVGRLNELELYVKIVRMFGESLADNRTPFQSAGLNALRETVLERLHAPLFERIERELPDIIRKIGKLASITLGINLDHNLKPIGATIVSINTEPFRGAGFFQKLLKDPTELSGISQLHTVPMQAVATADGRLVSTQRRGDPMLVPLFKDLDNLITDTIRPVAAALKEFLSINTQFLAMLEPEIVFYLGATRLSGDLTAHGLPTCCAQVAEAEARTCIIHDGYDLTLAQRLMDHQPGANLATQITVNDIVFGDEGRILIITGPNQGGKTTYIRAIGLAQVLFQAGLPVPGSSACISPVDGLYTHFPVEERPNSEAGRFGEEAQRLSDIFTQATRHSLILLNESLASTASGESLYLARDIVRCFRLLGVRAAYTTHMHELAANLDEFNEQTPGDSKVISLVAAAEMNPSAPPQDAIKRTYKIIASPPMGRSYAQELAAHYGISFDKLVETLAARHAIDPNLTQRVSS